MNDSAHGAGPRDGWSQPASIRTFQPLVEGPAVRLARRHAKVTREGYRVLMDIVDLPRSPTSTLRVRTR
jgi:hypothetical protein